MQLFFKLRWNLSWMLLSAGVVLCWLSTAEIVRSQSIVPAMDGTNTGVLPNSGTFEIQGGTQAGQNLFHSFEQFGLKSGETANFQTSPTVQNILSRVVGGDASVIDGLLKVTGGNANLYLMNPVGIVFGANARLDLPAAFTATTANGIGFGSGWFNGTGPNDLSRLVGNPQQFAFTTDRAGSIVNAGDLMAPSGLTLLGGTVVSTGKMAAPNGTVNVMTKTVGPDTLAGLITGGNLGDATGVTVENGVVRLTGSSVTINAGDVVANRVDSQNINLNAANNVTLVNSELRSMQELNIQAKDTVRIRDSVTQPVSLQSGSDLTIRGDRGIDILALNHPGIPIQSGGNLSLISDGDISGDAHFASGGTFSMRNTLGEPGRFVSLYDPVITSAGDVVFGDYTGVSLKVESKGSITAGNITITGPDTTFRVLPDWDTTGSFELLNGKSASSPSIVPATVFISTKTSANPTFKTRTPFAVQAGQTIRFNWNFATNEFTANNAEKDTATATLTREGGIAQVFNLASLDDTTLTNTKLGASSYNNTTGLKTFTSPVLTAGNYTLEIAVQKNGFNPGDSGILIQNTNPVPLQISDNSLMAAHPAVILRSGLTSLENPANLPQLNVPTIPTNFTASGTTPSRGDITVGNVDAVVGTNDAGIGGSIIINATGKVTAGIGGTLRSGSLDILAGGEIRTGEIRSNNSFTPQIYKPDGSVTLKNTDSKIIVDNIRNFQGGDITIDAYDGFQARTTTPIRSVTNSALNLSPVSVVTSGKISIQQGGAPIQVGLGVERDTNGAIVYRAVGGTRNGERVFIAPSAGPIGFVYGDGTNVSVPSEIRSVPFNPDTVPADTNYTAGAIFIGNGFDATLYGAFQDQQLIGSSNISIASVPRPPKPAPGGGGGSTGGGDVANGGGNGGGTVTPSADNSQAIAAANSQTNAINKQANQCPNDASGGSASTTIASRSSSSNPNNNSPDPCAKKQSKGQETLLKIDPALNP